MAFRRYVANKDTTITNAYNSTLTVKGTGSNMGASDVTEVFSLYGQASTSSVEKCRALYSFPISANGGAYKDIYKDRTDGNIAESGSVKFYLRLHNAEHASTLPKSASYAILAVSESWSEGIGLDMEEYKDKGYANWMARSSGTVVNYWGGGDLDYTGGVFHTASGDSIYSVFQEKGYEDIELDISELVERWISYVGSSGDQGAGDFWNPEDGIVVKLSGTYEDGADKRSYYSKKFFARGSQFFFKRPVIEARWDDTYKDDRGNFFYSSSLAPAANNLNTLYLYNYINGQLANIPGIGTETLRVQIYSGSSDDTAPSGTALTLAVGGGVQADNTTYITGGYYKTGIYTASFALTAAATPLATLYDVWLTQSITEGGRAEYSTGSIAATVRESSQVNFLDTYTLKITNLKDKYSIEERPRLRLFTRQKNQSPLNIYSKAIAEVQNNIIDDAYYKVLRSYDGYETVPFGTGSAVNDYTRLSFDVSGNYFDFDMSTLQPGYMYEFKFAFYLAGDYKEQEQIFKFRVE